MKKNFFFKFFLIFDQKKMLFFSKKGWRNFCRTIKMFLQNFFFGKPFKAWVSLIEKHYVDKKSKHLKKTIIFQIFEFFWEILWLFFQRIYSWKISVNLNLEKFSIFYQSLRDYNCGSNRCIATYRVSKRISWAWRICWEFFCGRLHFRPLYENLIFNYFWQKNLVFGKIWSIWPIWPADVANLI